MESIALAKQGKTYLCQLSHNKAGDWCKGEHNKRDSPLEDEANDKCTNEHRRTTN